MKFNKFYVGLILVITTFIASVISFYWLIFTIPIFIIGILIIIISNANRNQKILSILLPILLYFPATLLFLKAYNYTNPKEFRIPENYYGPLRIIYEEKCGQELMKENGNEVFTFPKNGILILSSKFNGKINHKYFFINKKGNKIEIPEQNFNEKLPTFPSISILGAGTMSYGEIKIGVNSNDDKNTFKFSDFYVNKSSSDSYNFKEKQKFDSLTIETVKKCREK